MSIGDVRGPDRGWLGVEMRIQVKLVGKTRSLYKTPFPHPAHAFPHPAHAFPHLSSTRACDRAFRRKQTPERTGDSEDASGRPSRRTCAIDKVVNVECCRMRANQNVGDAWGSDREPRALALIQNIFAREPWGKNNNRES
jgi:hypothetical protein